MSKFFRYLILFVLWIKEWIVWRMPSSFLRVFLKCDYVFIVHPLDYKEASKIYPVTKNMSVKEINFFARIWPPVVGGRIIGFRDKFNRLKKGLIIVSTLIPKQMVINRNLAQRKILNCVKFAEKLKAQIVGLGGFNSIVTHDGLDLVGKTSVKITTGNTYAAVLILQNIEKVLNLLELSRSHLTVAVVGAAGSVGSGCSRFLSENVKKLVLIDINIKELEKLVKELEGKFAQIEFSGELKRIKEADLVVTVTSSPKSIISREELRGGMILIDAAQPKNISSDIIKKRKDVVVIDSGIARVKGVQCNLEMGPYKGEVYACLGEILILNWSGNINKCSLGKVRLEDIKYLWRLAKNAGLELASFRNSSGFIENADVLRIKSFLNSKRG